MSKIIIENVQAGRLKFNQKITPMLDIEYVVETWQEHNTILDFKVYSVFGLNWSGPNGEGGEYMLCKDNDGRTEGVTDISEASVFMSGSIRWDGCSNLRFDGQDDIMLHFCGKQSAVDVGTLLGRLYDLAADEIESWDGGR